MQRVLSLIYPSDKMVDYDKSPKLLNISDETLNSLELDFVFDLSGRKLSEFFTNDKEVIEYRQKMFADLMENSQLCDLLLQLSPVLNDISEIRKLSDENQNVDSYLYSITEVELYVTAIELLYNGLSEIREGLKSEAFIELSNNIFELIESEYYNDLNKRINAVHVGRTSVRSGVRKSRCKSVATAIAVTFAKTGKTSRNAYRSAKRK